MKYNIHCKSCNRFLATVEKSTEITIKCSNSSCKKLETYKILFATDMDKENHNHAKQ